MTDQPISCRDEWPVSLAGIVESIVATRGPNGLWNLAALGLRANQNQTVRARTWGRTRTWNNLSRTGSGIILFSHDPVEFAAAALTIVERRDPIVESVDAWVAVSCRQVDSGRQNGTAWVDWHLQPLAGTVRNRRVPMINRGFNAIIEATIDVSRLGIPGYDDAELVGRLDRYERIVETCGSERDREAFDLIRNQIEQRRQ